MQIMTVMYTELLLFASGVILEYPYDVDTHSPVRWPLMPKTCCFPWGDPGSSQWPGLRLTTLTMLTVLCAAQRVGRWPKKPNVDRVSHPGSSHRLLTTSTMLTVLCAAQRVGVGLAK